MSQTKYEDTRYVIRNGHINPTTLYFSFYISVNYFDNVGVF